MTGLAKVGDRIEHGQPIPGNVVLLRDQDNDLWRRDSAGFTCLTDNTGTALADAGGWWPVTVVEVDPEPQPAEPAEVHYFISEFGPSGATLCGIGIEEDGDLSTTAEAGKGTCRDCRVALDEEPGGTASDAEMLEVLKERDDNAEWADRLAQAIGEYLGVDVGEHSNANLPWQAALIALEDATPAKDAPVVLRLPKVPEGAVALIGSQTGWRYVLWGDGTAGLWHSNDPDGGTEPGSFGALLHAEGGEVTVEFAPPREPRTWEQITDDTPTEELPNIVRVARASGPETWALDRNGVYFRKGDGVGLTLVELRTLGEVREVLS